MLGLALTSTLLRADDTLDQIDHDQLSRLYRVWRGWRGARDVPARSSLDPASIKFCLSNVALAEIEAEPFRVRYRLVGTRLNQMYGRELTNRYVDELYAPLIRTSVVNAYRRVVTTRQPHYEVVRFPKLLSRFSYYRLMLPFCWHGEAVDIVLVGIYSIHDPALPAELWRDFATWTD